MKFEKFFKRCGTHGKVIKIPTNNERWLVCEGVGMKIPNGVSTLGIEKDPSDIFKAILRADIEEDTLKLDSAEIPADGKASDIVRVFTTQYGDKIKISNADYGLLEKSDRLVYLEVEDENEETHKFMLITDFKAENVLGFIPEV